MFEHGRGTIQDYAQAAEWYSKAARKGHSEARYKIGWMYEEGIGVEQNYSRAMWWYKKAITSGYKDAQKFYDKLAAEGYQPEK